jgi:hypothetical protein
MRSGETVYLAAPSEKNEIVITLTFGAGGK